MLWESVKCDFEDISKWPIQKLIIETNLKFKNQYNFLDRPRAIHFSSKNLIPSRDLVPLKRAPR
jgi:hypothetical protein